MSDTLKESSIVLLFALLAALLLTPMGSHVLIPGADDYWSHLAAIVQAKLALSEGQFPLRVMPLEQSGWRYPFYQFYSPSVYMIAGSIYRWLVPSNPFMAYKLSLWFFEVLGGVYLYRVAYWLVRTRPAAILAGIVYLFAPYNVVVANHLGTLTQGMAFGVLPAVIYYAIQCYLQPGNTKCLLLCAFFGYLCLTMHVLTFVYLSLFLGLWFLMVSVADVQRARRLLSLFTAYVFILLLAMWNLAPILLYSSYLTVSAGIERTLPFIALAASYKSLLLPFASFQKTLSVGGSEHLCNVRSGIGWPLLLGAGICVFAFFKKSLVSAWLPRASLSSLLFVFFVVLFMVWSPVDFWPWMPKSLSVIEDSQRLLGQLMWVGALLLAWAVSWCVRPASQVSFVCVVGLVMVAATLLYFPAPVVERISITKLMSDPVLKFNINTYIVYPKQYPNFQFVDRIQVNSLVLYENKASQALFENPWASLLRKDHVELGHVYHIPGGMINGAVAPVIGLRGVVDMKDEVRDQPIGAYINDKLVSQRVLKQGKYIWNIPLSGVSDFSVPVSFELRSVGKWDSSSVKLPVDVVFLTGYLKQSETLQIDQMNTVCQHHQEDIVCQLKVPAKVNLVELPVLYYPGMLDVRLNGQRVPYQAGLYENRAIAAIVPASGRDNVIRVRFVGLPWANYVSAAAWLVWLLYAVYLGAVFGLTKMRRIGK